MITGTPVVSSDGPDDVRGDPDRLAARVLQPGVDPRRLTDGVGVG